MTTEEYFEEWWTPKELPKNGFNKTALLDFAEWYAQQKSLRQQPVVGWAAFDWGKIETRPTEYGKYLICRKDGKIHWETWNGSGWAYNHNEIRYWAVIVPPSNIIGELKNSNLSIQFAEWLSENEWVKRTKTHPNKVGQYYSHKHCEYKTIEQLFDMFSGVT